MIGIIDYGMGNLFSVSKALERLNVPYFISDEKEELMKANGLLLPGVGSFKDAMNRLNESGLTEMIKQYIETGKPLLGICLGMQLLFESSEENGHTKGLSILPGYVKKFPGTTKNGVKYKVPHMGWNKLSFVKSSSVLRNINEDFAYFVHSFYVETNEQEVILAECDYDVSVPAIVGIGNIYGMQFHPEKSSKLGMKLLSNFADLVEERMRV
jgi:imidazole glycerol-phosphate synthase subunit HisH